MTTPNIVNVTNIVGASDVQNVTTTFTAITTNPAASGKVYKINSLIVSNIDGALPADVSVGILRNSETFYLAKNMLVPPDATLVVVSKSIGLYLQEGDSISCLASADNDLQAVCSYEIITDA